MIYHVNQNKIKQRLTTRMNSKKQKQQLIKLKFDTVFKTKQWCSCEHVGCLSLTYSVSTNDKINKKKQQKNQLPKCKRDIYFINRIILLTVWNKQGKVCEEWRQLNKQRQYSNGTKIETFASKFKLQINFDQNSCVYI